LTETALGIGVIAPTKDFLKASHASTNIGSLLGDGSVMQFLVQGEAPGQPCGLSYNILQAAGRDF